MALRDWFVKTFGEGVARKIEQFVEGEVFGDALITCLACKTPVSAAFIVEHRYWGYCQ